MIDSNCPLCRDLIAYYDKHRKLYNYGCYLLEQKYTSDPINGETWMKNLLKNEDKNGMSWSLKQHWEDVGGPDDAIFEPSLQLSHMHYPPKNPPQREIYSLSYFGEPIYGITFVSSWLKDHSLSTADLCFDVWQYCMDSILDRCPTAKNKYELMNNPSFQRYLKRIADNPSSGRRQSQIVEYDLIDNMYDKKIGLFVEAEQWKEIYDGRCVIISLSTGLIPDLANIVNEYVDGLS